MWTKEQEEDIFRKIEESTLFDAEEMQILNKLIATSRFFDSVGVLGGFFKRIVIWFVVVGGALLVWKEGVIQWLRSLL